MALTTAQYRGHILGALKSTIQAEPRLLLPLLPGLIAYAQTGAAEREAMEILLTWAWQHLRGGAFNGHAYKHLLADAGTPAASLADVTERSEP